MRRRQQTEDRSISNINNENDEVLVKRGSLRKSSPPPHVEEVTDISNTDNEDYTFMGSLRRLYGCPPTTETCGTSTGYKEFCGSGEYCHDKTKFYCLKKKENGVSSSANKQCKSGFCYDAIGQCATKGELEFGMPCKKDNWCASGACSNDGDDSICLQERWKGCTEYEDCADGRCIKIAGLGGGKVCVRKLMVDNACIVDNDCYSGYCGKFTTCENGLCEEEFKCKRPMLDGCTSDGQCYTGNCAPRRMPPFDNLETKCRNPPLVWNAILMLNVKCFAMVVIAPDTFRVCPVTTTIVTACRDYVAVEFAPKDSQERMGLALHCNTRTIAFHCKRVKTLV